MVAFPSRYHVGWEHLRGASSETDPMIGSVFFIFPARFFPLGFFVTQAKTFKKKGGGIHNWPIVLDKSIGAG